MVATGATTKKVERRRMYDRGVVTRDMFIEMQLSEGMLEDGTPVGRLFMDAGYSHLLLLDRGLLVIDPTRYNEAMLAINANRVAVFAFMSNNGSLAQQRKAKEALAALDWLKGEYDSFRMNMVAEEPEEEGRGAPPIGATERTPLQDGGASDKSAGFFQEKLLKMLEE